MRKLEHSKRAHRISTELLTTAELDKPFILRCEINRLLRTKLGTRRAKELSSEQPGQGNQKWKYRGMLPAKGRKTGLFVFKW
jgi:hypothetical protein